MIWIGTSGFQLRGVEKGIFYPDKMSATKMLPYYAQHFPTTEINYTFRRLPTTRPCQTGWRRRQNNSVHLEGAAEHHGFSAPAKL